MSDEYIRDMKVRTVSLQYEAAVERLRPFILLRPKVFPDGDQWCALLGDNIQEGVVGFGSTPAAAALDFDANWKSAVQRTERNLSVEDLWERMTHYARQWNLARRNERLMPEPGTPEAVFADAVHELNAIDCPGCSNKTVHGVNLDRLCERCRESFERFTEEKHDD